MRNVIEYLEGGDEEFDRVEIEDYDDHFCIKLKNLVKEDEICITLSDDDFIRLKESIVFLSKRLKKNE